MLQGILGDLLTTLSDRSIQVFTSHFHDSYRARCVLWRATILNRPRYTSSTRTVDHKTTKGKTISAEFEHTL